MGIGENESQILLRVFRNGAKGRVTGVTYHRTTQSATCATSVGGCYGGDLVNTELVVAVPQSKRVKKVETKKTLDVTMEDVKPTHAP